MFAPAIINIKLSVETIIVKDLHLAEYEAAWKFQETLMQRNLQAKAGAAERDSVTGTQHYFLLCEHPNVFTLGKNGNINNLLISKEEQEKKQVAYFHINRGGDITYHGPGQLVGYPILDLEKFSTDIGLYLRNLEEVIIMTLKEFGISAGRSKGETGVWIDAAIPSKARKICAIGIRCSRWITMHGFALNVNTDLSYFDMIIPCGIQNKKVTSMEAELGSKIDLEQVKASICRNFEEVFECALMISAASKVNYLV
ncbi:MAG: lipoyl(octanoyl) transferase LipB [Rhizobacter sp.]|nr:lipoyl(octanoyl) transferase LipB [Ferruginibacter sp.]